MKLSAIFLASLATLTITGNTLAAPDLSSPLPLTLPGKSVAPTVTSLVSNMASAMNKGGPAGNVDKVLEQISRNMQPAPDQIDAQAETAINRDMNLSRSSGQFLRPVGYTKIGDQQVIYASEDGQRMMRLKEGSRIGVMTIKKISENGIEYTVSGKNMYAPLAYTASEPPKMPTQGAQAPQAGQQAMSTPTPNQGRQ